MAQLGRPPKAPKLQIVELVEASNCLMMQGRLKPLLACGWRLVGPVVVLPPQYYFATLTREIDAPQVTDD